MKRLFKTPKHGGNKADISTPVTEAMQEMFSTPSQEKSKKATTTLKAGKVTKAKTPTAAKTPHLRGVRELLQTPKAAKTPSMKGVKELLNTPKEGTKKKH